MNQSPNIPGTALSLQCSSHNSRFSLFQIAFEQHKTQTNHLLLQKMPKRLSYTTVSRVTETWDLAKSKPNFEEKVGTDLLLKYVCDLTTK